ncbi:MAG: permease [Acidobacteria bacterium]|nr:MAG: permease [Acidobacteriota bacterium]PYY22005.1 MAG: permease [Acidobacteriota bacterium]
MSFELFIAARYLRAKRRQAVIGVVTAISIVGVAAGVASLIIALAITNGFRQDLQNRLLGSTAHVSLERVRADGIRDWRSLLQKTQSQPHIVAASPALYEKVLVSRGARANGLLLKGVIPQYELLVSELLGDVKIGSAEALKASDAFIKGAAQGALETQADTQANSGSPVTVAGAQATSGPKKAAGTTESSAPYPPIVLGEDLGNDLGTTLGSVVLVTSPQGELTPYGLVPKYKRFKVVGFFKSGFFDYDSSWGLIRLEDAQALFGLGDIVSVIETKIDDIYKAPEISIELENAAGPGYMTTNWQEQNRPLFRALRLEGVVTFITISLIVFVAALNILISLTMMVMEKTKDIAVLMSMGTRKVQIRKIFVYQGLLIGVVGTIMGLVGGYVLSYAGGHYHWIRLSAEVYSIDYVPFAPKAVHGVLVAATAILVSLLATIYPSWSAARILPVEALRYE